jgi:hypothetical protein
VSYRILHCGRKGTKKSEKRRAISEKFAVVIVFFSKNIRIRLQIRIFFDTFAGEIEKRHYEIDRTDTTATGTHAS